MTEAKVRVQSVHKTCACGHNSAFPVTYLAQMLSSQASSQALDIISLDCALQALAQICKGLMASHTSSQSEPIPEALVKQSVLHRYESIDSTRQASMKKMGRHGQHMVGSIEELNISDNPIGLLGIKAVSEFLTPAFNTVQRITRLILNKCEIPDFGGMALAQALQNNATLVELQISANQLSDAAAAAFGKTLQMNSTLEQLDLSWNNIKVAVRLLLAPLTLFAQHVQQSDNMIPSTLSAVYDLPELSLSDHHVSGD